MENLHRSQLLNEVKGLWPHLASDINAAQGIFHIEMAVIRQHAQRLIDIHDESGLASCYLLIDRYFANGNQSMRAAIDQSFVEDLEFRKGREYEQRWAWDLLPERLKELYVAFHSAPFV